MRAALLTACSSHTSMYIRPLSAAHALGSNPASNSTRMLSVASFSIANSITVCPDGDGV